MSQYWIRVPASWLHDGSFDRDDDRKLLFYFLERVNPRETNIVHGVTLKPGRIFVGTRQVAKVLHIDSTKVYRLQLKFEKQGKIRRKPFRHGTLITILPESLWLYGRVNSNETVSGAAPETLSETITETHQTPENVINIIGSCKSRTRNETQFDTQTHTQTETHSENKLDRKKENISLLGKESFLGDKKAKAVASLPASELRDAFCSKYLECHGVAYNWTVKDYGLTKNLLGYVAESKNGNTSKALDTAISSYLADTDTWITEHGHPFWILVREPQRWVKASSPTYGKPEF